MNNVRIKTAPRPLRRAALISLGGLLTFAAVWLYAHEGHAPLPTRGAQVDVDKGLIVLSGESRAVLDVQTAEVEERPVRDAVLAYATLVSPWQRHGFASSRLPGRIVSLRVQAGQPVKVGEVLAEVQSLELENLQLELVNARNDIRLTEQIVKSLRESSATISGQTILNAESKLQRYRNALEVAKAKWLVQGLSQTALDGVLDETNPQRVATIPVRAPVGGIVIHADLSVGKVIEPGEHLFEIVDLSKVWAKVGVLERDLGRIEVGQTVEVRLTAYPGEVFTSAVRVKGLLLDPQTHLNTVWAEFENPEGREPRLLPGMSGQAQIQMPLRSGTKIVPGDALIDDGVERYVLLEQANAEKSSEYVKTPVVVGRRTEEWAEVQSGNLFPGTRVVTQGAHELAGFLLPGVLRLSPEASKTIGLKVEPAQAQIVEQVVEVTGSVDVPPDRRTFASAHLPGNVVRIHVDVGQRVQAKQVLGEVIGTELQNLQLELLKEHLAVQLVEQQYRDLNSVAASVSAIQLLELESERNSAINRRDNLRRRLEVIGLEPAQIDGVLARKELIEAVPIRSPVDGVVVHFDKAVGQAIKAEEPLFEVHDLSRPLVQAFISERDLKKVRLSQHARIRFVSDPTTVITGKIARSGRVFAIGDQTLSVWLELDKPPAQPLRHNQLARIVLTGEAPPAVLALPKAAIVRDGILAFAFVRKPDGIFDRRAVETGRADDRFIEIRRGLIEGELVAIGGAAELWTAYSSLR